MLCYGSCTSLVGGPNTVSYAVESCVSCLQMGSDGVRWGGGGGGGGGDRKSAHKPTTNLLWLTTTRIQLNLAIPDLVEAESFLYQNIPKPPLPPQLST